MQRFIFSLCLLLAAPVSARVISIRTTSGQWVDVDVRSVKAAGASVAFVVSAYDVELEPDGKREPAAMRANPKPASSRTSGSCITILDQEGAVAKRLGTYTTYGWTVTVRNNCDSDEHITVKYALFDGKVPLDSDRARATVPAHDTVSIDGELFTQTSVLKRATDVRATIHH